MGLRDRNKDDLFLRILETKSKILPREVLVIFLAGIIFFALPMIVIGVEKAIVGTVAFIGFGFWLGACGYLMAWIFEKIIDNF